MIRSTSLGDHSFSTYAKFSYAYACVSGSTNFSFSENFAHALNEYRLNSKECLPPFQCEMFNERLPRMSAPLFSQKERSFKKQYLKGGAHLGITQKNSIIQPIQLTALFFFCTQWYFTTRVLKKKRKTLYSSVIITVLIVSLNREVESILMSF